MQLFRANIQSLFPFLLSSGFFILLGLFFLAVYPKENIHLSINGAHSSLLDAFFMYFTFVGDGVTTSILAIVISTILFKKYGWSTFVLGGLTLIFTGILTQFFKQFIFPDALRPLAFLGEGQIRLVPGEVMNMHNSFPSGHTASAFAFFLFLAFVLLRKRKTLQVFAACAAALVGYSRMYLSQHFLEDVVFGSILGIVAFLLAYVITAWLLPTVGILQITGQSSEKSST